MNLQGLFGIQEIKIQHADGERQGGHNLKKLNRSNVEQGHRKIGKHEKNRMMRELREIPTEFVLGRSIMDVFSTIVSTLWKEVCSVVLAAKGAYSTQNNGRQ